MGSRSKARARAQANGAAADRRPGPEAAERSRAAAVAAGVQAVEAAGVLAASVLAGIAAIGGKAYQSSSGVAITLIGVGTAVTLGFLAAGLARSRSWSRTPALMTQLFCGIVGIYLLQGHRYQWGIPAVTLATAGFAAIAAPAVRAAVRRGR